MSEKRVRNDKSVQHLRGAKLREFKRQEFQRLMATIPPDTRDLTSRIAGDPLPGRSHLDRKRMQADG